MWVRNEWVLTRGQWVQDSDEMCLIGMREPYDSVRKSMAACPEHQWITTDDLIIGIPAPGVDAYLVVSHREVLRAR